MTVETGIITSLCMVNDIGINKAGLIRIADLIDGRLIPFEAKPGIKIFENRDRIFRKSGPDDEGFVGIWEWSAVDNTNNIGSDYVDRSIYMPNLDPIRIVKVYNAESPDDVIRNLVHGIELSNIEHDIIFVNNALSRGVFCRKDALEKSGNIVKIKRDQFSLPVVSLSPRKDIISIPVYPGGDYYAFLSIRKTDEYVYAMDPISTVKSLILQEFTRKKFQAMTGGSIKEFKQFKEIVDSIGNNESILSRIMDVYHCSVPTAMYYVNEFQERANELINEDDVTDSMLQGIVANSSVLIEKAKNDIKQKWEQEHKEVVEEKKAELLSLVQQVESAKNRLAQTVEEEQNIQNHIAEIENELKKRRALGDDALRYVHEKLELAKEDVAKFLAERISFSGTYTERSVGQKEQSSDEKISAPCNVQDENVKRINSLNLPSNHLIDHVEKASDLMDLLSLIGDNLEIAGVNSEVLNLAAYLVSAYQERFSILLVGPGGEAIVQAFSAGVTGKTPLILDCVGPVSTEAIQSIREGDEDIILVRNIFDSEWKNAVINMIDSTGKMFFCVYPFSEDLFMEPRSLYSYVAPLFTETYFGKSSNESFFGNDNREILNKEEFSEWKNPYRNLLNKMRLSKYAIDRIGRLLSWFWKFSNNAGENFDYLYCLFPYAVVTDSGDILLKDINENSALSLRWKDYYTEYFKRD